MPEGTSEFDVSEGDLAAYVICRERGKISSQLMTRAIEGRARWREIKVAAQAPCGPEMLAHLGDDHLVVRSYEALELLRRENGRWSTLHQLRCPRRTTLLAIPKRACVLAATSSVLTFYGRSGDQLVKLTTGRIARRADGNHPTAFVRADGALFVNGRRIEIGGGAR